MNPYVLLGAAALITASYFYGRYDGAQLCEARHDRARIEARSKADKTAADTEKKLAEGREARREIRSEVNAYAATPAANRECLSDDGMRHWRRIVGMPGESTPPAEPATAGSGE